MWVAFIPIVVLVLGKRSLYWNYWGGSQVFSALQSYRDQINRSNGGGWLSAPLITMDVLSWNCRGWATNMH